MRSPRTPAPPGAPPPDDGLDGLVEAMGTVAIAKRGQPNPTPASSARCVSV